MVAGWKAWVLALGVGAMIPAAAPARDLIAHRASATVSGATSVPYGWVDFCRRYEGACDGPVLPAKDITLTLQAWHDIERIDRRVNGAVTPTTDLAHWGVVDQWDYPADGKGDCEDYALWKRKLLIEAGYPRQAVLITVVKDHAGEGHAVLTVKTDHGDLVLDNMTDTILPWSDTGYRFVKRQSQEDPNVWQSIGPSESAPLFTAR